MDQDYAWQALSREKKTRNWLARNFSQEMRCEKCEKFVGISLSIVTHFLNQIDQLSTPKKRRSSHPLLDCWSAWIIIHTNWLWLGIWSWNIFADVIFELACHWTYFSEKLRYAFTEIFVTGTMKKIYYEFLYINNFFNLGTSSKFIHDFPTLYVTH